MVKFDTINGTLCLMLEQPIQLTPVAKFPCVVRLIQDDSQMGKYNKLLSDQCLIAFISDGIIDNSINIPKGKTPRFAYVCYEILGYPVADGSAEWAAWRMQEGDKVTQAPSIHHYAMNSNGVVFCYPHNGNPHHPRTADEWLKQKKTVDPTGWQIYAEKPLLAEARKGDLCQRRDGKWVQIEGIDDLLCPVTDISVGQDRYDAHGIHSGCDMRLHRNPALDIVSTEPLAPIGSAEWAWQMAKLGIETRCYEGKIRVSKSGLIEVCYNGMAYAMPLTQSAENRQYVINKMRECSPDGWQLYESKPEPKVQVGKMSNLLPCPFCGKHPRQYKTELQSRPCFYYECENQKCQASEKGWHDTEQEAVAAWNQRPIEDALRARIEELEKAIDGLTLFISGLDECDIYDQNNLRRELDYYFAINLPAPPEEVSNDES